MSQMVWAPTKWAPKVWVPLNVCGSHLTLRGSHVNSTRVPYGAHLNSTWVPRGASIHEGAPILGAFRYSIDYYIQLVPLKKCYCWELSPLNCWSAYNWQLHCQPVYCANSCIHFSYKIFMNKEYDWKVYNTLSQTFMKTLHNLDMLSLSRSSCTAECSSYCYLFAFHLQLLLLM